MNSNKYYIKALNYYENGYIDKALDACEMSISLDLKNKAALNLKGILYYLKGELNDAEAIWKLNSQMNKDSVAQKYLAGIDLDYERQKIYINAVKYVNEVRINEAVELLMQCEQSDYNAINVNNYLCICYMKQCKYEEAKEKLNKVLQFDRRNEIAMNLRKQLIEYNIINRKRNTKSVIKAVVVILIVTAFAAAVINIYKHININTRKTNLSSTQTKNGIKQAVKKKQPVKAGQPENTVQATAEVQFPVADFQNALNNKDFEGIYKYDTEWESKSLDINDKKLLSEGQKLLANDGTAYFYRSGASFLQKKDYSNAIVQFGKAYANGSGSYLYPHIIYFLATSYNNSKDFVNAVKYYELYDKSFPKGDYEETVLYNLAMIYTDIDTTKAKQYACRLSKDYSNSIYNNTNIQEILKK